MKKPYYLASTFVLIFAGCAANDIAGPKSDPVAQSYFFPQTNGNQYTYSQHNLSVIDTSTYQIKVGGQYGDFTQLLKQDNGYPGTEVLYFYKTTQDRDGVLKCIMSRSGNTDDALIALKGLLTVGSTWFADAKEQIQASVVEHYTTFLLPGQEQIYSDVVAVKYADKNAIDDIYTLRFFARDFGLILERSIVGKASENTNLQLLSTSKANTITAGKASDRNYWYDNNHRYMMAPALQDDEDKK